MALQLSEKGKENLRRNEESRNQQQHVYQNATTEKKGSLHFDAEKIEPVEIEFEGKKTTRYQYTVTDPNYPDHTREIHHFQQEIFSS